MLSLFCVLKGLKLGLIRGKPWLEASSQVAQSWGELGLLMHVPHSRYSSAWQKKKEVEAEVQRGLATSPLLQPPPLACACPSLAARDVHSAPAPGYPCCSRAGLFLCCRGGAVTSVKPGMCFCAFQHEAFQSVNYREHLQLLFKSQHCLCATPCTGRRGWEQGTHGWILSPARAPASPTTAGPWGVQHPEPLALDKFGVWVMFPSVMSP